jgi:hypothetical protein
MNTKPEFISKDEIIKMKPLEPMSKEDMPKARISVNESIYHQEYGGSQPTPNKPIRFGRDIDTDEQPYSRKITVTEEWKPIEKGWIEKCGLLTIENLEAFKKDPDKTIEVGVGVEGNIYRFTQIRAGEGMRLDPIEFGALRIHCCKGSVKALITLYPE